jgi:RES domain-containing protein
VITGWRIVDARYADDAFSGEGARLHKGRWHSAGYRVVYICQSVSLATLELLVRVPRARLLSGYVVVSCSFPEVLVEDLDQKRLPDTWRDYPAPPELQELGTEWVVGRESAVLRVPSAIVPGEYNFLLNPEHEHFGSIDFGQPRPFHVDFRLLN